MSYVLENIKAISKDNRRELFEYGDNGVWKVSKYLKIKEDCVLGNHYHKNKELKTTKQNNTIAEVKFHTPLEELTGGKYNFLIWWIKYLYSLKPKQMPSYNLMLKKLKSENNNCNNMNIEIIKK